MNILLEMSHFFASMQMHALDDTVWKDGEQIQAIWEETTQEHGQTSIVEVSWRVVSWRTVS
jgi:hypothetical protein